MPMPPLEYLNVALIVGGAVVGGWLGAERRIARMNGKMDLLAEKLETQEEQREELKDSLDRCQEKRDADHRGIFHRLGHVENKAARLEGRMNGAKGD